MKVTAPLASVRQETGLQTPVAPAFWPLTVKSTGMPATWLGSPETVAVTVWLLVVLSSFVAVAGLRPRSTTPSVVSAVASVPSSAMAVAVMVFMPTVNPEVMSTLESDIETGSEPVVLPMERPLALISRLAMLVRVAGSTVLSVLGSATSVQVPPVASAICRSAWPASQALAAPPPIPKVWITVPASIASCNGDPAPVVKVVGVPSDTKNAVLTSAAAPAITVFMFDRPAS